MEKAVKIAEQLVREAALCQREECDISELILGTECGGSDPTSGLSANPVVGNLSDRLVDLGGTSILSETTEFVGAEHILAERGRTEDNTTGRGTPVGNPIAPVIKITGNKRTFENMFDNMDFDTSDSISGGKTVEQLGEELLEMVIDIANGKQTKAEMLGMNEIAISRLCNYC